MTEEEVFAYGGRLQDLSAAFVRDNIDQIYVVGVTAVLIAAGLCSMWLYKRFLGRKPPMKKAEYVLGKRQQKQAENNLIADGVADLLLNLYCKGKLTPERYAYWHLRFGTQLAMKPLLPGKLEPSQVKEAMKKRIGNGVYKPVVFPDTNKKKGRRPRNALDALMNKTATV